MDSSNGLALAVCRHRLRQAVDIDVASFRFEDALNLFGGHRTFGMTYEHFGKS